MHFWAIGALFVIGLAVLHIAAQVLLLVFAGVLFGVSLRGGARWLAKRLGWPTRRAIPFLVLLLLVAGAAIAVWTIPRIAAQIEVLADVVGSAYTQIHRQLASSSVGRYVLDATPSLGSHLDYVGRALGLLATLVGLVSSLVIVVFVALYVASSPNLYRDGLVALWPLTRRDRAIAILDELASTLRRWLLGRFVSMSAVGVTTTIGLWLLGIPLPVTLGLIAGSFGFVPNIGPVVSAVPALLLAGVIDLAHVGYVLALYLAVNFADGYILTPSIQRRAVATPPALVLSAQALFGALWGILGVMFATPMIACLIVLVHRTYVEAGSIDAPST